eukprot:TRINITY_DN55708_c0_g1_i1.p1 TRINITY_DN55708_c0_g1~~TRINITY_DN55708_c0_g1_i1.p1  ORF type:complete len:231 (+),score=17.52 TRINITY_DN55708_c0_g1_i1:116-808(+)
MNIFASRSSCRFPWRTAANTRSTLVSLSMDHSIAFSCFCEKLVKPAGLTITQGPTPDPDPKGTAYEACALHLDGVPAEYRTAKITPTKNGAFVTCWRRHRPGGDIVPFSHTDGVKVLIVAVSEQEHFGCFVFTQSELFVRGIFASENKKGKLAFRVYAPWVVPESKQAASTQAWQKPFFLQHPWGALQFDRFVKAIGVCSTGGESGRKCANKRASDGSGVGLPPKRSRTS